MSPQLTSVSKIRFVCFVLFCFVLFFGGGVIFNAFDFLKNVLCMVTKVNSVISKLFWSSHTRINLLQRK